MMTLSGSAVHSETLTQGLKRRSVHPAPTPVLHRSQMTVLITGATSGIGYAATQRLLKDGHRVIALCRDADHGLQRLGTWTDN